MAQIIIKERDLTGNPAASVFDVALVPGLTINDLSSSDKYQYGKPYYFNSVASFQAAMGSLPVELTGDGIPYTYSKESGITCPATTGQIKYFFASGAGEFDRGYIYATELLNAGIPIYYLPIQGTTAKAVYDALEGIETTYQEDEISRKTSQWTNRNNRTII